MTSSTTRQPAVAGDEWPCVTVNRTARGSQGPGPLAAAELAAERIGTFLQ
jgi:hypothetical protein